MLHGGGVGRVHLAVVVAAAPQPAQVVVGQATFTMQQVLIGDQVVAALIGAALVIGSWAFDREQILGRLT